MARRSFLRTWLRRLMLLVVCVSLVLAFMYSERIGRYPWRWQGADLSGFADFCLGKFEEAREGTQTLIARFEDSKLAADLDQLYERMNEKLRRKREQVPAEPGEPAAPPESTPHLLAGTEPEPARPPEPSPSQPAAEPARPPAAEPAPSATAAPEKVEPEGGATLAVAAPAAEPELSAAEQLFMQGYELKRQGNQLQGGEAEALYRQAAEVWKKQAVPALTREIELAEAHADKQRVRELEQLYQSLNVFLHDIFKDSRMP